MMAKLKIIDEPVPNSNLTEFTITILWKPNEPVPSSFSSGIHGFPDNILEMDSGHTVFTRTMTAPNQFGPILNNLYRTILNGFGELPNI